jgi:hypothetical protein
MAATYTVNFNFVKPAQGDGEENSQTWADGMNANLDQIDSLLKGLQSPRASVSVTTPVLAPGATWEGTITLPKASDLLRIATDRPCVVRAYGSAAARTADSTRPYTQPPRGGTGLQFQGTTIPELLSFSCDASLFNDDGEVVTTIYLSVMSMDISSGTITITPTVVPKEH